jgi:DNA-binding MarR family transcriptional regulator
MKILKTFGYWKIIEWPNGTTSRLPLDAPLEDSYDTTKDKGSMFSNTILNSSLSSKAKLMYFALRQARYYNTGVVCYSVKTLGNLCGYCPKTAQRALKELEDHNIIKIKRTYENSKKRNYYYTMPEVFWKNMEPLEDNYSNP